MARGGHHLVHGVESTREVVVEQRLVQGVVVHLRHAHTGQTHARMRHMTKPLLMHTCSLNLLNKLQFRYYTGMCSFENLHSANVFMHKWVILCSFIIVINSSSVFLRQLNMSDFWNLTSVLKTRKLFVWLKVHKFIISSASSLKKKQKTSSCLCQSGQQVTEHFDSNFLATTSKKRPSQELLVLIAQRLQTSVLK